MKPSVAMVGFMVGLVSAAGSIRAQEQAEKKYIPPQCELNTGHFLVKSSVVYVKGATEERDSAKAERMLADAKRNLLEALERGENENPAVWYFLGRVYKMEDDPFGADSAFARAEGIEPLCAADLAYHRQSMWVPIINAGVDSLRAGAFESAKTEFRRAGAIWAKDNIGFYYLARIFGDQSQADSAIHYFRKVIETPITDTARQVNYDASVQNMGRIFVMLAQQTGSPELWDSSIVWYQRYRTEIRDDPQVLLWIGDAYSEKGDEEQAMLVYDSVLTRANEMGSADLFRVGEAFFLVERFSLASRAFESGLKENPYSQHGLYNLVNTYLAVANDDTKPTEERRHYAEEMEQTARRLVDVHPQSLGSLRLLAAALQLQERDADTRKVMRQIDAVTFEVDVDDDRPVPGGYQLKGRIINLKGQDTSVPELAFEFLSANGNVVATDTVARSLLQGNASTTFQLTLQGEGIVAWRYRVGSL